MAQTNDGNGYAPLVDLLATPAGEEAPAPATKVQCPYCKGTKVGTYWVHSLEATIDAECHSCDGTGEVAPEDVEDAERERGDA